MLQANELMVDDWVFRPDCYDQVKEIRHTGIIGIDGMRGLIAFSELEPIPLTEKILEKNGFGRNRPYQYTYKDNFCKVCVSFAPKIEIDGMDLGEPPINVSIEGALFNIDMSISSIHELQHALRLCGIKKEIIL